MKARIQVPAIGNICQTRALKFFLSSQEGSREVSREEGQRLAQKFGCLFAETSAKANVAVNQAFVELVNKILDTPDLLSSVHTAGVRPGVRPSQTSSSCC